MSHLASLSLASLVCLFYFNNSWSQEMVPTVVIDGQDKVQTPIDRFSVFKKEYVSQDKINQASRQSLSEIVQDQVGVDSQVYCANCGAKRLTINGLKGEHTSLLIDGLPLHSAVSSFYGVDNVPANGVASIEVMRGTGASLTNPEAIGGTLNIQTVDPLNAANHYLTSFGLNDELSGQSQNHQLLYNYRNDAKKWGISLGGQLARMETWDEDNNKISEMPQRENFSGMAKTRFLIGNKNDFSMRLSYSQLEILGGYFEPTKPNNVRTQSAAESDFVDGNVEKEFIGDPSQVTDWISLKRRETAFTGTHYLSDKITLDWKLGQARQEQSAIYQHGFDYANIDNILVGDTQIQYAIDDSQIVTAGVFFKDQRLRSSSEILFTPNPGLNLASDAFDFQSQAIYGQYSVLVGKKLELDFAVRADQVSMNWLDLVNEIQETVIAPRFQLLHNWTEHLSQRLSYGLGYRAPLTFFESQHGNQENGYEVDITSLEKAHSVVYSLSYNKPSYYVTGSGHYTRLQNMAYGFEEIGSPIKYRNTEESYDIWVTDLLLGYKPTDWWLIETSFEFFQYEDGYKRKLPTAAIEKRFQLSSKIDYGPWSHNLRATLVGSRDLSKYSTYDNHYINRNQAAEPVLDSSLRLKKQKSPTWLTIDTGVTYSFSKSWNLGLNIRNLFDYTQASAGDTPATWHWHFDHAHYDGLHTWGPNQGRQFLLSLSGTF